jgi:hypothetical protein
MGLNEFYCQPCDHRWWQHRHPDPKVRRIGIALMVVGVIQSALGLSVVLAH